MDINLENKMVRTKKVKNMVAEPTDEEVSKMKEVVADEKKKREEKERQIKLYALMADVTELNQLKAEQEDLATMINGWDGDVKLTDSQGIKRSKNYYVQTYYTIKAGVMYKSKQIFDLMRQNSIEESELNKFMKDKL